MLRALLLVTYFAVILAVTDPQQQQTNLQHPAQLQQSLETLFFGRLTHCQWNRKTTLPALSQSFESVLGLHNTTGFADVFFGYQHDPTSNNTTSMRIANMLIARFYDTQYINTFHAQVRVPLLNYSSTQRRWKGETQSTITYHNRSTRLGSFNKSIQFEVDERQIIILLTPIEVMLVSEITSITFRYFPIIYIVFICVASAFVELTHEQTVRNLSPLMAVIMAIKILCRSVFFLTQSFITPKPYGGILVMMAVLNTFLMIRFIHRYSRCFQTRKHNRAATLTVLVLMSLEVLLVFSPWFNVASCLLLVMQIIVNTTTRRNAHPQNSFLACFITHYMLVIYYTLCEDNVFRVEPVAWAAYIISILLFIQLAVLKLQQTKTLLRKYLHKKKPPVDFGELTLTDCPICLSVIGTEPFIVTDCKHTFHEECLKSWVEIRSVCPLDRKIIDKCLLDEL